MFIEEQIRKLHPIGTILFLKGARKHVMIIGICQSDANDPEKDYDYIGVLYPEGNLGTGSQFFFNSDAIDEVVFEGYRSDEWEKLLERISDYYQKQRSK